MENQYILAIDQSTSGTKVLLVNKEGDITYKMSKEHAQYYPQPGWVEHEPKEIMENVWELLREGAAQIVGDDEIISIAITNQRETAIIWDKETGEPIYNAIVWQCRRTAEICEQVKTEGNEAIVEDKTGLKVDPYFSATKFNWIINHVDGARDKLIEGRLMAGTIDAWLIWNLTGRAAYKTDVTNASRTLLYNIYELKWDEQLMEVFGLTGLMLPEVCPCDADFGETDLRGFLQKPLKIQGVIGDSQGALFAQKCYKNGTAKATYGTGTSIMMNTGTSPVRSKSGLVTAIAWGQGNSVNYALEGIINCSGDTLNWLKNNLGLFETHDEIEGYCTSIPDNEGVYLVPALVGYGIPYWNPYAKAAVLGMTRATTKAHLIRAGVESIIYQIHDAIEVMENVSGIPLKSLKADGGAMGNNFLLQFQADILGKEVVASEVKELSAMGAVYMAGFKSGLFKDINSVGNGTNRCIQPSMNQEQRDKNLKGWKTAVESVVLSV